MDATAAVVSVALAFAVADFLAAVFGILCCWLFVLDRTPLTLPLLTASRIAGPPKTFDSAPLFFASGGASAGSYRPPTGRGRLAMHPAPPLSRFALPVLFTTFLLPGPPGFFRATAPAAVPPFPAAAFALRRSARQSASLSSRDSD